MILGPDGKPLKAGAAPESAADPYEMRLFAGTKLDSHEMRAFIDARRQELDVAFNEIDRLVAETMYAGMEPGPRVPLTRRQRARIAWHRFRRAIAMPLVTLADWISPGISSEDCDC